MVFIIILSAAAGELPGASYSTQGSLAAFFASAGIGGGTSSDADLFNIHVIQNSSWNRVWCRRAWLVERPHNRQVLKDSPALGYKVGLQ
jgi:hypothetical protein